MGSSPLRADLWVYLETPQADLWVHSHGLSITGVELWLGPILPSGSLRYNPTNILATTDISNTDRLELSQGQF